MPASLAELTSGSNATLSTTSGTGNVTVSGSPILIAVSIANSASGFGISGIQWNGGSQALTRLDSVSDGTQIGMDVWYIDAPTPATDSFTITHNNLSSRRDIGVYEVSGHDTSSASAWRDVAVTDHNSTTDAETAVTSATGDTPVLFIGVRNSSSAPTLTLNGNSTSITDFLGGTTLRLYACYGTGAASVTLGGTLSGAGNSAAVGLNINSAATGGGGVNVVARARALLRAATRAAIMSSQIAQLRRAQFAQRVGAFHPGGAFGIASGSGIVGGVSAANERHSASRLRRARRKR